MVTVNAKAILELRAVIYKETYKFDMTRLYTNLHEGCGCAGCIGGHAATIWPEIRDGVHGNAFTWDDSKLARKLGVTLIQAEAICFPEELSSKSRWDACEMLLTLATTGEVVWP